MNRFLISFLAVLVPFLAHCNMDSEVNEIFSFWFGNLECGEDYPYSKERLWFIKDESLDLEIKERFEDKILAAYRGELSHWSETAKGRLAMIILLDQFSRNVYRNTPNAFAFDDVARSYVLEGLHRGDDRKLYPVERLFFYLPLEHAEDRELQELAIKKFEELKNEAPEILKSKFESFFQYALRHKEIIDRFGRFPHRNHILGRESTSEELEFLKQPNSAF